MKRMLILLGVTWSLSAAVGPSYAADDSGFLSSVKSMVANVAQRSSVTGALAYVLNDAPSASATALPEYVNEWGLEADAQVALNPKMALFGHVEMGVDNRILRSKFGITRKLWSGK